ncbi:unnamed protein product [Candidula unifasciata]|uniref:Uncharacterized protein n=1 Tax=Candidula unifasciata TaxID=100452 RepID=A0A8S3Z661_9EUPU|nr:unnamed protein product [Candidula unifasciata]
MANSCLVLGLVSSILGLTCVVIALASSQWLKVRAPFFQNDVGLMRHCDVTSPYCGDMENLNALVNHDYAGWFRTVQAMYLLHCLGLLISAVAYLLYLIRFLEVKGSFRALAMLNFIALVAGVFSVTMFGVQMEEFFGVANPSLPDGVASLGYAFYMAILGCCLSFVVLMLSAMEAIHAIDLIRDMQNRFTVWTTPYTLFVEEEP